MLRFLQEKYVFESEVAGGGGGGGGGGGERDLY